MARPSNVSAGTSRRSLHDQQILVSRLRQLIGPQPRQRAEVPGMRVAVRHLPADRHAGVGGDWHQIIPLPDGDLLLAVGDVSGHGLDAAATMMQMRHAVAALGAAGLPPADILAALNSVLYRQCSDRLVTAVVATYRPATRELTWACAGHPPMLVAHEGVARELGGPAGVILGGYPDPPYPQVRQYLEVGDVLLMYTDGVVEERGGYIDEGIRALGRRVTSVIRATDADSTDPDPADAIVTALSRSPVGDDACLLAAAVGPGR
jgi:serine phosphatase RsbU (regulator of sigma subunit)